MYFVTIVSAAIALLSWFSFIQPLSVNSFSSSFHSSEIRQLMESKDNEEKKQHKDHQPTLEEITEEDEWEFDLDGLIDFNVNPSFIELYDKADAEDYAISIEDVLKYESTELEETE